MCDPDFNALKDPPVKGDDGKLVAHTWKDDQTLEEYNEWPSRKLDVLKEIIQHHLATDNAPPLKFVDGELKPDLEAPLPDVKEGLPRDKVVVYSAFPSNGRILHRVRQFLCM